MLRLNFVHQVIDEVRKFDVHFLLDDLGVFFCLRQPFLVSMQLHDLLQFLLNSGVINLLGCLAFVSGLLGGLISLLLIVFLSLLRPVALIVIIVLPILHLVDHLLLQEHGVHLIHLVHVVHLVHLVVLERPLLLLLVSLHHHVLPTFLLRTRGSLLLLGELLLVLHQAR